MLMYNNGIIIMETCKRFQQISWKTTLAKWREVSEGSNGIIGLNPDVS